MSNLTFKPGREDGKRWTHNNQPDLQRLVYLQVEAEGHDFSGWVAPDVAKLVKAAPDLLALARKFASECAECGGSGVVHVKQHPGGIEIDGERDCEDCADIRAVIAKATTV